MRSRWFHPPVLHSPVPGVERKVSWLELFYDLIFVASLIQLGNALSHHVDVTGVLTFIGMYVAMWSAWTSFTFYENRFIIDDVAHRALVFVQMFFIGAMAINVGGVFTGNTTPFAIFYALVRLCLALLYLRTLVQVKEARALCMRWSLTFFLEAALWFGSAFVTSPWTQLLWGLGVATNLSLPVSKSARELAAKYPTDLAHLSERFGLFTLIVLGESFAKMLSSLSENRSGSLLMACFTLIVTCSLWSIYFDDIAGSRIRKWAGAPFIWVYSHLPLTAALTAVGVGAQKVVFSDPGVAALSHFRWLFAGALGAALFTTGIVDWATERRQPELSDSARVKTRLASGAFILLLAPAGQYMPSSLFVGLLAAIGIAQVIIDLFITPHDVPQTTQPIDDIDEPIVKRPRKRHDISDAYRRGTPSELRRNFYFFFMEGSWTRLFISFIFSYFFVNIVFASLYMMEPGAIDNVGKESFSDAFFFSIQTISTIGFGTMSPVSGYGHAVVAIEAVAGVIMVALITGMVFAKASRPVSNVLFSDKLVITKKDGKQILMIRLGNGRGNDVVDASIKLSVLVERVSPEGHHFRRFQNLKLVRKNSPVFILSWTVMHEINETSPLWGIDWEADRDHAFVSIVAIMTGHDSTYAQTTHARKLYYPEDVRPGRRFKDILTTIADGRLMIDYTKFHHTISDPPSDPPDLVSSNEREESE